MTVGASNVMFFLGQRGSLNPVALMRVGQLMSRLPAFQGLHAVSEFLFMFYSYRRLLQVVFMRTRTCLCVLVCLFIDINLWGWIWNERSPSGNHWDKKELRGNVMHQKRLWGTVYRLNREGERKDLFWMGELYRTKVNASASVWNDAWGWIFCISTQTGQTVE